MAIPCYNNYNNLIIII